MSNEGKINLDESEKEKKKKQKKRNKDHNESHQFKYENITPENILDSKAYTVNHYDDIENKWKAYLYEGIKGDLRKRLNEIIIKSEYSDFF